MKVHVPTSESSPIVFSQIPGLPNTETNQKCLVIFVVLLETDTSGEAAAAMISRKRKAIPRKRKAQTQT